MVPPGTMKMDCLICNERVPQNVRRLQLHLATKHVAVGLEEYFDTQMRGGTVAGLKRCSVAVRRQTREQLCRLKKPALPARVRCAPQTFVPVVF